METQPGLDNIPETEPSGSRAKKGKEKKGKEKKATTREPNIKWTVEEEIALAKGWIDISEDAEKGNAQKSYSFWNRVLEYFQKEMGDTSRNVHQVTSKWKNMNKVVGQFGAIYNNLAMSGKRQSGISDADLIKNAHLAFKEIYGKQFALQHVWEVVRNNAKWAPVPPPTSSKRSKTTDSNTLSDAQNNPIDLNNELADEEEEETHFVEPQRPVGKKKAKRSVASSSSAISTEEFNTLVQNLSGFRSDLREYNEKLLDQNERKLKLKEEKELRKGAQFLAQSDAGLEGEDLNIVRKAKDLIRKKFLSK